MARASVRCQAAVGNATTRRLRGGRRRSTALTRTARTARGSWAPSEVPSPCLGRGTGAHPCSPGCGATHRVAYASGTDPPAHAPEGAPRTSPHGRRSCAAYRDATPTTCATPTTRLHPSAPLPAARRRRSQQRRIVAFPRVTRPARGVSDRAALRVLPASRHGPIPHLARPPATPPASPGSWPSACNPASPGNQHDPGRRSAIAGSVATGPAVRRRPRRRSTHAGRAAREHACHTPAPEHETTIHRPSTGALRHAGRPDRRTIERTGARRTRSMNTGSGSTTGRRQIPGARSVRRETRTGYAAGHGRRTPRLVRARPAPGDESRDAPRLGRAGDAGE